MRERLLIFVKFVVLKDSEFFLENDVENPSQLKNVIKYGYWTLY